MSSYICERLHWIVRGSFLLGRHQHLQGVDHVPQGCAGPVRLDHPESGLRVSADTAGPTGGEEALRRFSMLSVDYSSRGNVFESCSVGVPLCLVEKQDCLWR